MIPLPAGFRQAVNVICLKAKRSLSRSDSDQPSANQQEVR